MKDAIETLDRLGIEEKQAKVYLACLELGSATIQELAEKSGIKRTSIYNFLEEIKNKGLVSEIKKGNKNLLIAEDPNNLKKRLENNLKKIEEVLPDLMGIFNLPGSKPKMRYYEGMDGIRKVYEDTYSHGGKLYGFADWDKIMPNDEMDEWLWKFADERKKRGVKFFAIVKEGRFAREAKKREKDQLRESKIVDDVQFETELNMYGGNRVAMMSFRQPYSAIIIEDKAIHNTLMSIWKLLWKNIN
jgi:HTH-type transcriptional regulator, sugar sensing transcriptional regulator